MPFFLLLMFIFILFANPALLVPSLGSIRPAQLAGFGAMAILLAERKTECMVCPFGRMT